MSSRKTRTGSERAFIEQSMVYRPAFAEHLSVVYFSAKDEKASIVRAFDDHHSQEEQALVEHLMDRDRPLLLLLADI